MQCRILILAVAMMAAIASHAGRLSAAADPAVTVVDWSSQESEAAKAVLSNLVRWPSDEELASPIADSDSLAARRCCQEWLMLVIQPDWVPPDIDARLKPVRRSPADYDLLVAKYAVADCSFRIWDTSVTLTIEISSPSLRSDVTDWPTFLKSVMGRFLNGSGRDDARIELDEFTRCTVHRSGAVARMLLNYPVPAVREDNPKRYWEEGNPVFWKQGGQLVVHLTKLPDGEHPLHPEYGLKQRFPPVESQLASATLDQLVGYVVAVDPRDPDTMAWSRLAERAIWNRPDKLSIVMPLLCSIGRARGEYAQLMVINAVGSLLRDCSDRQLLEAAKESLLGMRAELKGRRVQRQMANVLKRVDDLLQAAGPERE